MYKCNSQPLKKVDPNIQSLKGLIQIQPLKKVDPNISTKLMAYTNVNKSNKMFSNSNIIFIYFIYNNGIRFSLYI
jgi:hypothetical protein